MLTFILNSLPGLELAYLHNGGFIFGHAQEPTKKGRLSPEYRAHGHDALLPGFVGRHIAVLGSAARGLHATGANAVPIPTTNRF